jgi:hypothetical protein
MVSEHDKHIFMYGACGGLALALYESTGWPLVIVSDADSVYGSDESPLDDASLEARALVSNKAGMGASGLHWMVLHPSGRLLDVNGLHDPQTIVCEYDSEADGGVAALGRADEMNLREEYEEKGEPADLEHCSTVAQQLLASI